MFPLLLSLKPYHVCVGFMPLFAHNFMTAVQNAPKACFFDQCDQAMLNQSNAENEPPVLQRQVFACTSKRPLCDLMRRFT